MASSSASPRIPELDGLRGIAISLVVLIHYFYQDPPSLDHPAGLANHVYLWFQRCIALGWSGVDLFFVLSGFLIGGILLDAKDSPSYYKTFYMRRVYRILPAYYVWISCYVLLLVSVRVLIVSYFPDPFGLPLGGEVFWLFLFIQNVAFSSHVTLGWAWLSPTWSLAVEEQFYLVAPLLIRRLSRRALFLTLWAVVLLDPLLRMWVHFHLPNNKANLDLAYTLMPCRADALAIGLLTAIFWRTQSFRAWLSNHSRLLYVLTGIFLAGVVVLGRWSPENSSLPMESVGYTWLAVFYGLVLLLALERPAGPVASLTRMRWLCELGRVSYCVYLIHLGAGWIFRALLRSILVNPLPWEYAASSCLAAIVVYVVARASWKDIEYPLLRRGHAYQY